MQEGVQDIQDMSADEFNYSKKLFTIEYVVLMMHGVSTCFTRPAQRRPTPGRPRSRYGSTVSTFLFERLKTAT